MNPKAEKRLAVAWIALSAVTLLSWRIGSQNGQDALRMNTAITVSVMAIAAVKVRVIIREFMEVRHAPILLRRLTDAWIALLFAAILGIYLIGIGIQD